MHFKAVITLLSISLLAVELPLAAQRPALTRAPVLTQAIDESKLHTLRGNTRPEVNPANDRGLVPDNLPMDHLMLQLQRSPDQQRALDQFTEDLHNPKSPSYHQWLTAAEIGKQFGLAPQDLSTISSWLQSHGFTVNSVYSNGLLIDFSGTAGQIRQTFHTEIHSLDVNGVRHIANMTDPQIPEALASAIAGIVSLHDFRPRAMVSKQIKKRTDFSFTSGGYNYEAVTPGDLATIYNLTPLFAGGNTGAGQTIALIEDADLYSNQDWTTFRNTFGLSQYTAGSLTTVHPSGSSAANNCAAPGLAGGDDGEAALDVEWASAAAPSAAIQLVSCAGTKTTFGGMIAIQNLIDSANPPRILSLSYGECEAENGASANSAFSLAFQQAVAEGISVFVAAGDEGAASCDAGATSASHGIGVSGFASTPYNVAVGGTDFGDSSLGTNASYWNSSNGADYTSAFSYIPEIPWNDSCASSLLANYFGYSTTYGTSGFCGSSTGQHYYLNVVAGSGGPSNCATGNSAANGLANGTCEGYAKPSWQTGAGVPADGVRDLPDVSLFAADGAWGHYLVFCWSDLKNGGASCAGDPSTWAGGGGTSFSTPIMAGIQALVNARAGGPQGNPNYVYYQLAASGSCDSSNGDSAVSGCIFHSVTRGDIDVNCGGTADCYGATISSHGGGRIPGGAGGGNGALSVSDQAFSPAYGTAGGWSFASGNGSVNAYNLVNAWNSVAVP
ncbi:MAG TPA: S53 family peptidase [Bryobacteraceae bacterium]